MKKIITILTAILSTVFCYSQGKTNSTYIAPSPEATFEQEIGSSVVKINYSRPLVRGRKIFGSLVPMDSLWRTGAGNATTIYVSEEISFGNEKLPTGKYSLFTIPGLSSWVIIINKDTTLHGSSGYNIKKDVFRITVPVESTKNFYETFTIEINDINEKSEGFLKIIWENTQVRIPIKGKID